ncbi:MAG: excinuclease ABC subunit UvrC [Alphaproteobacteria bacterium]|nr:excinuclease ABC subunit UvrC [Alphaproteobacteria bacterium]
MPASESEPNAVAAPRGAEAIRAALLTMPGTPGVYRMLDARGNALYVGKARNLKKRVTQYLQLGRMSNRLQRMVNETCSMEIVTTHTEVEALLLEINLIKRLAPRFNVLLRDDKSFPYIVVTGGHAFPRIAKHRGAREKQDRYFGPFASAGAVNQTLTALQRAFLLRSCSDAVFASRTRPCLLYQIKRCSAPCVGRIDEAAYAKLVDEASAFLSGRSHEVQGDLAKRMQAASEAMAFETAALYRDRIRALTQVQARQDINVEGIGDADVIAAHQAGGTTAIQVFFFRGGRNYGNRAYFPRHDRAQDCAEVLAGFVGQFYEDRPAPPQILLSEEIAEADLLAEALSQKAGYRVRLHVPERGEKRKPVEHALVNAREALARRLAETGAQAELLEGVARVFGLDEPPRRIEVYDNSHTQGTAAQGAMIVAGPDGFIKAAYRRFNIRGGAAGEAAAVEPETPPPAEAVAAPAGGDDYAMMREVFRRRFGRALEEDPGRTGETWPDLVLVDGGLGQLNAVRGVMVELGLEDLCVVGIAKGPDRDAGRERFFMPGRAAFQLEPRDPVLYFLQRLRDEAHRFAIGGHRARRTREAVRSPLDEVPGIGPKRKKALLLHFGSAKAVSRAGLGDLEAAPGVSRSVAKKVYEHFHSSG